MPARFLLVPMFFLTLSLIVPPAVPATRFIFKEQEYSFQALRAISATAGGGADIGECLNTLGRIKEGDEESWFAEWRKRAEELESAAESALAADRGISARQRFYRACNYYRSAEFFLRSEAQRSRALETWRKSRECFLKGARLSEAPIKPVEIPFEGTTLPGYLCLVDSRKIRRPLLVLQTGFDGTGEELYFEVAVFALKRGYNCLIFEGPGQGRVIREQKIPFRPNWETVVTPVIDFALKQKPFVDPKRIALLGISFGGYLAPRAVAFEHRIRACIANGGVYDFHAVARLTPQLEESLESEEGSRDIDNYVYQAMKTNPSTRWSMNNAMFTFHAGSPSEWLRMTKAYTMKEAAAEIRCPMLIVDSEDENAFPGQAGKLYDALKGPKSFMFFTRNEGAGEHCQVGAYTLSSERILDWLDSEMNNPN